MTNDEWWKNKLEAEVNELKHRVKEYIKHEVVEIEHCLRREEPNFQMALDRAGNIKAFLNRL